MESREARGECNEQVFLLLVSRSNHTLTNQQFVNCAYLEILSLCPALLCLPTCRQALASRVFLTQSLARPSFWSTGNRLVQWAFHLSILLVAQ